WSTALGDGESETRRDDPFLERNGRDDESKETRRKWLVLTPVSTHMLCRIFNGFGDRLIPATAYQGSTAEDLVVQNVWNRRNQYQEPHKLSYLIFSKTTLTGDDGNIDGDCGGGDNGNMNGDLCHPRSLDSDCTHEDIDDERQALLQFKHGLIDEANQLASWVGKESDCCRWAGIGCDNSTGHVHRIHLPGSSGFGVKLIATPTGECNRIAHYSVLEVFYTATDGNVINTLPSLVVLHLCNSQLLHTYPHVASLNLTSLSLLDLSRNNFRNSFVPSWIFSQTGYEFIISIRRVCLWLIQYFSNTSLTIYLKVILSANHKLGVLSLESSQISCHLPHQLGQLTNLMVLQLGNNLIAGVIPESIGRLTLLRYLDLDENLISGPIPNSIGELSSLEVLDLSYNQLNGSLPDSLGQLSKTEVPKWIREQLNTTTAAFKLDSFFPAAVIVFKFLGVGASISIVVATAERFRTFWRSFSNLQYLDMSQNQIHGELFHIPASLQVLDLSSNKFSGLLPQISNGSSAMILDLSNNSFVGLLDHLMCPCGLKSLQILNLADNHLSVTNI
ncbi:receptor-like protein EIX2, partial [Tanacetum coccineum]